MAVCLVAIAGGVAIGLMPLGSGPGQGVSADLGAADQAERLRSNEREDPARSTTTADGAPSTDAAVPAAPDGVDPGPGAPVPVSAIPALDWLRRLSPRPATRTGLHAAELAGGSDAAAPDQGLTDLGVFSWLAPVTGSAPTSTVAPAPPSPTSTAPVAPPTTRPPTTLPEVTTTEPETTTTVPEVTTTTEPEATTTVPDPPVDPPA